MCSFKSLLEQCIDRIRELPYIQASQPFGHVLLCIVWLWCCCAGGHRGHASAAAPDRLNLHLTWDDPYGGAGLDEFSMPSPDVLHVNSSITVKGKTCNYRSVYNRKG